MQTIKKILAYLIVFLVLIAVVLWAGHRFRPTASGNLHVRQTSLSLYRLVSEGDLNAAFSPLSARIALVILSNGTVGEARSQITQLLVQEPTPQDQLNQNFYQLLQTLQKQPESVTFNFSNSLWLLRGFKVNQTFNRNVLQYFSATVNKVDAFDSNAISTINTWTNNATGGEIGGLLSHPLPPNTQMLLVNAILFHAPWLLPFNKIMTGPGAFHDGDTTLRVAMMHQTNLLLYAKTKNWQIIRLPYKSTGTGLGMWILLPTDSDADLRGDLKDLTQTGLQQLIKQTEPTKVELSLPRFGFESSFNLVGALQDMGVNNIFISGRDNFPLINPSVPLAVSVIHQEVKIAVDEAGTVAAAGTATGLTTAVVVRPRPAKIVMTVNHPFLFVIRDQDTDTLLFIGQVYRPELTY